MSLRWLPLLIGCVASGAIAAPEISLHSPLGNLPGRPDYLAPGGSITLQVESPEDATVTWYRDDLIIATTAIGELTLSGLSAADAGNYRAVWAGETTTITPVNIGQLPVSHFANPALTACEFGDRNQTTLQRVLPDGRVVGFTTHWAGVGQNRSHFTLSTALLDYTRFHYYAYGLPSLVGVLDDGAFVLSESPFLHDDSGNALPFALPAGFDLEQDFLNAAVDRTGSDLLLMSYQYLAGVERDGTVEFTRSPASFGFVDFHSAVRLPDGRVAVHGVLAPTTPGESAPGRTIVLTDTGNQDTTFTPIENPNLALPPTLLYDGTWARLADGNYERYAANGSPLDTRPLPVGLPRADLQLTANGDVYGAVAGLGMVRYPAASLTLDPGFFVPQRLDHAPTQLRPVLPRADGGVILVASNANDPNLVRVFAEASARADHTGALPVIAQTLLVYHHDTTDSAYQRWTPYSGATPQFGAPYSLRAPFFSGSPAEAHWVPLDATQAVTTDADGTLRLPAYSAAYAGRYQLVVENAAGRALGPVVDFRPRGYSRLVNLSGRSRVDSGERSAMAGFVLERRAGAPADADADVNMLLRGIGPSLAAFDIAAPLPDPVLDWHEQPGGLLARNDDWATETSVNGLLLARVGAFTVPVNSRDAALGRRAQPGIYSTLTQAKDGEAGIALTEIYRDDPDDTAAVELRNLSLRGYAGNGDNVLAAGFVIDDPDQLGRPLRLLIRGIGPTLVDYGVNLALSDPLLRLFAADGTPLAQNNDWSDSPDAAAIAQSAEAVGAFALPTLSRDAVVLVTLPPGAYTVHVQPSASSEGIALLEIYLLDN